ncbi:MAG: HlyD family efflux transporter periplasmic adaptor subunit [Xenococcus sp. MO_188.B8]|nr:HlyD family efflux transporter periplasmic adaptor subunit [Xenococcus sp. MO_188.B8]
MSNKFLMNGAGNLLNKHSEDVAAVENDDSNQSSLSLQKSSSAVKVYEETVDWSPSLQNLLDQPPVNLPKRMILGGMIFFIAFGFWAWLGKVEEVGKAQGKLVPKGETYKVESVELGKITHIAVKEGEEVKAGQLLAKLDTNLAVKEVERLEQILAASKIELGQKQAQFERVNLEFQTHERISEAETVGKRSAINSAQNKAQVLRQLLLQQKAEIEAYQTRKKLLNSVPQISQKRFEQVSLELEAHQERLARLRELEKSGGVSKEFIFQAEQAQRQAQLQLLENKAQEITNVSEQLFQAEQSLRDLAEQKTQSQGELASALKEIEQLEADLKRTQAERSRMMLEAEQKIQQLKLEITQIEAKITETQNLLATAQTKLQEKFLKSPIDGVVLSLNVKNSGKVFNPGATIAEISPRESPLVLNAVMPNQESGFIEIGMPVQIKLDAYSYQDFGTIPGKVISISSDAESDEKLGSVYSVEIELEQDYIVKDQELLRFKPGQTATADIIIRRRRVLDLFLDPIKQIQKDGIDL